VLTQTAFKRSWVAQVQLDGEFSGTFPSGNGTAGGDFVATFTINAQVLRMTNLSVTPGSTLSSPPANIVATLSNNPALPAPDLQELSVKMLAAKWTLKNHPAIAST
jgi:hypothetical protein